MATGPRLAAVSIVTSFALVAAGYAWADAADVVPGVLTARPPAAPPPEPGPEPVVEVPAPVVDDLAGSADGAGPADPGPGEAAVPALDAPAPLDAAALAAELAPLLADPALGPAPSLSVRDLATGDEVVTRSSTTPVEPASTVKVLTAAAALEVLGAERTLPTRVAWVDAADRASGRPAVVLVGGGDLLLAPGEGSPGETDGRVGLLDLARAGVLAATEGPPDQRLLRPGVAVVDVVVDDSLLGGGPVLPRDPVDAVFASPPTSLAVAAGRRAGQGRDPDPAATAARAFAAALEQALGEALGPAAPATGEPVVSTSAVPVGPVLAEGRSAPVVDVLGYLLVTSDNTVADAVAGLVAAERGGSTALPAAGLAVVDVVEQDLAVDLGPTTAADGSGLGDGSLSSAAALTALLAAAAAAPADDDLSLLPPLLPVAGLEGTLEDRFTGSERSAAGRGVVRAKTGTLTGVVALAGVGTTASGRGVAFALLSEGVPAGGTEPARAAADRVAAAVAACC